MLSGGAVLEDGDGIELVQCYNPRSDVWTEKSPMLIPRSGSGACVLDGTIYIIGKQGLLSPQLFNIEIYIHIHVVTLHFKYFTLNKRYNTYQIIHRCSCNTSLMLHIVYKRFFTTVHVGGWHASTENTNKVECYNPRTNQWSQRASMSERRYRPGVAVVGGKIYVCGGEEGWDR